MKHLIIFALLASTALGASVIVSWDQSTDPAVTSHIVRYGLSSASKTNVVTVTGTNAVLITVPDNARLVLDVTAVNSIGIKSIPTPEISFSTAIPATPVNVRVAGQ